MLTELSVGTRFRDFEGAPELMVIPKGSFEMGSREGPPAERPPRVITLHHSIAVGVYPVTFDEWELCFRDGGTTYFPNAMPRNPSVSGGQWARGRRPVINVGWYDAQEFVKWLTARSQRKYRLPSEAEWEYFARAGTTTEYTFGDRLEGSGLANCADCEVSGRSLNTTEVGKYPSNGFGICDVHGNVWEWVQDSRNEDTYAGAPTDGSAWEKNQQAYRMLRGGSWHDKAGQLRSAHRKWSSTGFRFNGGTLGFRVVRDLTPTELGISLSALTRPLSKFDVEDSVREMSSVQAGIIAPVRAANRVLIAVSFNKGAQAGKALLRVLSDQIHSATQQSRYENRLKDDGDLGKICWKTIYLSATGYQTLGADTSAFESTFVTGLRGAQARLRDPLSSELEEPYASKSIDALVDVRGDSANILTDDIRKLVKLIEKYGQVLTLEVGHQRTDNRGRVIGPFGFADGISQPTIFERSEKKAIAASVWDATAPPGLVLIPDPLCRKHGLGSYLVYRKYLTFERKFSEEVEKIRTRMGEESSREQIEAFFFGRFRDGTPLVLADRPLDGGEINNFDYKSDPNGTRCPFHAHIRKMNPRGEHLGREERNRRILRRGTTFWAGRTFLPEEIAKEKTTYDDNGLLFMCFQGSIAHQFEFIQTNWANDQLFLYGEFPGEDPIVGRRSNGDGVGDPDYVVDQVSVQKWPKAWGATRDERMEFDIKAITRLVGGEYLFAPSLAWLTAI